LRRMQAAYEELRRDAALPATFEVIYGAAWGAAARAAVPAVAGETVIAPGSIRLAARP